MDIVEIESLAEKRKWQKRFAKAYTLGEVRISDKTFGDNVRFFVAVKDGNELGFIRINDKTNQFDIDDDTQVWNAADAYVKPAYRSKGVLKELITFVIENHSVKMCSLDPQLIDKHADYYKALGFVSASRGANSGMIWLYHKNLGDLV